MMDPEKKYYLEDVIEITGISERNIKFWVAEYHLKVIKEGRKNLYPAQTTLLLHLIRDLSESKFFTAKFIQVQVERCKDPQKSNIHGLSELNEITKRMIQYIFEINNLQGLPQEQEDVKPITGSETPVTEGIEVSKTEAKAEAKRAENSSRVIIDDFAWDSDGDHNFQPIPAAQDDSMRKILKELKSPILSLADEPREKRHSFWQQLKKILK